MGLLDGIMGLMSGKAQEAKPAAGSPDGILVPADVGGDAALVGQPDMTAQPAQGVVLTPEDQGIARSLVAKLFRQSDISRRLLVKRCLRAANAFEGRLDLVWDDGLQSYVAMSGVDLASYKLDDEGDEPDQLLNINIVQQTGRSIIAALAAGKPTVSWKPGKASNPLDQQTAEACDAILENFYATNNYKTVLNQKALNLWNEGKYFAFVRFVRDAVRWGTHQEPIYGPPQPTQVSPAMITCPQCGKSTEVTMEHDGMCDQCGAMLDPNTITDPVMAMVPPVLGQKDVANGAEIISVFAHTDVRTPPEAQNVGACSYLALQSDEDPAYMKAMYSTLADAITTGGSQMDGSLVEERLTRLRMKSNVGGAGLGNAEGGDKVTYTRIWMRPYLWYAIDDKPARDRFLKALPNGALLVFAGNTFCEATSEGMDDFWVSCAALPGKMNAPPGLADILLDVQDGANDIFDSIMQCVRHAVPFTLVNNELINLEEFDQSRIRGGSMLPVNMSATQRSLQEQILSTGTSVMPAQAVQIFNDLIGRMAQQLTGALPGMTGQGDPNLATAHAYEQARLQALAMLGPTWEQMKEAEVKIAELAVMHFRNNRTEDVTMPELTPTGFKDKTIKLSSLQGKAVASAESNETYPMSMAEKRDNIEKLTMSSPAAGAGMSLPENAEIVRELFNLGEFKLPGDGARVKQLKEIAALLAGQPIQPPDIPGQPIVDPMTGQPMIDPMTGQPAMGPPITPPEEPSIPVSPKTDDSANEYKAGVAWFQTEEAFEAAQSNPNGYRNVVLHVSAHYDLMMSPAPPTPQPMAGPPGQGSPMPLPSGPGTPQSGGPASSSQGPLPPSGAPPGPGAQ